MQIEPKISFHGMDSSPAVEAKALKRIEELEQFHDRIISCHVKIEAPHRHGRHGKIYHVSIDLKVPGGEVAVTNAHELNHAHEDIYVALRDSFDAADRRLEDIARRMDPNRVKPHPPIGHGSVARLMTADGYGFIETPDGREFYFDRDSLTAGEWDTLTPGTVVRFTEREGENGPFATAVRLVRAKPTA
jgi:cold shock CspA family protein/ribosome-associated translation inhibitor RaiA